MKKLLLILTATTACLYTAQAQISVGPSGSGVLTFPARPAVAEGWSSLSFAGSGGTFTDPTAMDTDVVNNRTAAAITTQVGNSASINPPTDSSLFRFNSANFYLQSRPTGNAYSMLLATLRNDSGADISTITIAYDYGVEVGANRTISEDIPGHRVFWSLTGATGSWTPIPNLSGITTAQALTAVVNVGTWAQNQPLYILWADDNGPGAGWDPDNVTAQEGVYTIDNFSVTIGGVIQESVTITSPTEGATFPEGAPITITAFASLAGTITDVSFYRDGGILIGSDTTAPYSVVYNNATFGAHQLIARATDDTHSVDSAAVNINVVANDPPVVNLTAPIPGTNVLVGTLVPVAATATDAGGAITAVEFYVDGVLKWTDTTSAYTYNYGDSLAGAQTISAVAIDSSGARSTNSLSINVTNPPNVTVLIPNGSTWRYLDDGNAPAVDWNLSTFDDSSWLTGAGELGFGDTDANRPETTVIRRFIGTPPGATTNTTFYFRRVVNIADPSAYQSMILNVQQDDGAIVYVNGNEVYRATNMIGINGHGAFATSTQPDDGAAYYTTNLPTGVFSAGNNLIAVEVHQNNFTSSDISFDLMLWGVVPEGPSLRITRVSDTQVKISWPTSADPAQLYFKNDLGDANWTLEPTTPTVNGSNYEVVVTTTTRRFWTLRL